ncbi:MAG TPA: YozE family protein [Polyangiaceae bacterium]|nr:YozE family protein [Polyangiaceae bacterium]
MAAFTNFYDWLGKQKNLRSPIGDMARETARDEAFPRDVTTLDGVIEHLQKANASSATLARARATWKVFARGGR